MNKTYSAVPIRLSDLNLDDDEWPCKGDLLGRLKEIENLSPVLLNAEAPLVFAVDAPWGSGKTTFIRLWEHYLSREGKVSLYLNAWESDFAEDPFLPMLATLDTWLCKQSKASSSKKAWDKAKSYAPGIAKSAAVSAVKAATFGVLDIGKEYEKLVSELAGEAAGGLIDQFNIQAKSLDKFKKQLFKALDALPEGQENLIVFVDELDRCKPTYAIDVLERIKHLFDIERLVFVLAINREQLSKSLQGVYGQNFDGVHYLRRFIDLDYQLKVPDINAYIRSQLNQPDIQSRNKTQFIQQELSWVMEIFCWLSRRFGCQLRDVNQLITRFRLILRSIPEDRPISPQVLTALLFLRERNPDLYQTLREDPAQINEVILFLLGRPVADGIFPDAFPRAAGVILGLLVEEDNRSEALTYWCQVRDQYEQNDKRYQTVERLRDTAARQDSSGSRWLTKLIYDRIELIEKINISD